MSPESQPDRPGRPLLRRLLGRFSATELGGLAKDTGFVGIWQAAIISAGLAQIALLTHAFGLSGYGRFAVIVAFVELVGGFFNLRVGYASTTFGARWLVRDPRTAAGVFQYSFVIDLATTALAVPLLAVLALTAGPHVAGDGSTDLIILYAFALIGPVLSRMSFVILRLLDRFALIATYQWALELGRVVLIFLAIELFHSLLAVIVAILVARLIAGVINITVAARVFRRAHDLPLTRPQLHCLERSERRSMLRMMFHTFLISYSHVVRAQLPTVLLGALAGPTQTGIYRIGIAGAAAVGKVIAPASNALLPRLSRMWAAGRLSELRKMIFRASLISGAAMGVAFLAIVIFQNPILRFLGGGPEGEAAGTVLIIGAATQALYGLVFWHSTLLFASDNTGPMSVVNVVAAIVHILSLLVLVPSFGATGAAWALLASQGLINVSLTTLALRAMRSATAEAAAAADGPTAAPAAAG